MLNTDADAPAGVTCSRRPAFILEVDQTEQFTGSNDGLRPGDDPIGDDVVGARHRRHLIRRW